MNKVEFLQKESELFLIFNSFGMSKEFLKYRTYSEICVRFYKKSNKDLQNFYDNLKMGEDRSDFIDLEILFKQILFGCDDRLPIASREEQLFKAMCEYIEIKIVYFQNKTELFADKIFRAISLFVEQGYKMWFSTKNMFQKLGDKIDEYFENLLRKENKDLLTNIIKKSDEIHKKIKENPDSIWIPNTEENRKILDEKDDGYCFTPEWQVPTDKIILTSTPTSNNSFYKQFIKSKISVKDRNEKICEDDILNLEIAFNTAKTFEEFLNLV